MKHINIHLGFISILFLFFNCAGFQAVHYIPPKSPILASYWKISDIKIEKNRKKIDLEDLDWSSGFSLADSYVYQTCFHHITSLDQLKNFYKKIGAGKIKEGDILLFGTPDNKTPIHTGIVYRRIGSTIYFYNPIDGRRVIYKMDLKHPRKRTVSGRLANNLIFNRPAGSLFMAALRPSGCGI